MENVKLGDYTKIKTGKLNANASNENGEYPFFTCSNHILKINEYAYDCECVLVAGNGDLNVKYYNGKFNAYQRTYIMESKDKHTLDTKYMYYLINSKINQLRNKSIGGVIKYIKLNDLTDLILKKINLREQKNIVNKLDKIQEIIYLKQKQIDLLDELIKSKFIEMFGDPITNNKNFDRVRLKHCIRSIENGKSFICNSNCRKGEYPGMLKLSAVTYGVYEENENKSLLDENMYVPKAEVKNGDLLFTRKNTPELVGMSVYVYNTQPNLMLPDLIFRLNTLDNCNKVYLWKLINNPLFRSEIKAISNGSAKSMSNISKENLMNLEIILPPMELQNEYEIIVNKIEKQKEKYKVQLNKTQELMNTLMNQYFN